MSSSPAPAGAARFENPANGHVESLKGASLGTFLFGPFYMAYKGATMPALLWFLFTLFSGGLFWLFGWIFAPEALRKHYLQAGWKELPPEEDATPVKIQEKKRSAKHQAKLDEAARKMGWK